MERRSRVTAKFQSAIETTTGRFDSLLIQAINCMQLLFFADANDAAPIRSPADMIAEAMTCSCERS